MILLMLLAAGFVLLAVAWVLGTVCTGDEEDDGE